MVISVCYRTDNQLTRNCPTENSKIGKVRTISIKELIKHDFSGKKDTVIFLPQVIKILQQRILWKILNI
jgi:hypothetical protein